MKCAHCGRSIASPWVMTRGGPVGPKCGRQLGLKRPALPKPSAIRQAARRWNDERQIDWIGAAA